MSAERTPFRFPCSQGLEGGVAELVDLRRRAFFARLAAGGALLLAPAALMGTPTTHPSAPTEASEGPWRTLAEAQAHLFPSEPQAPGAQEVQALAYLRAALAAPDVPPAEREFILAGAQWLGEEAARSHGGARFGQLPEDAREALLLRLAESADGANWIALVLHYIIEAVLTDPVYGGNPDGIGWRWLGYTPGYPRPPADRRYVDLLER